MHRANAPNTPNLLIAERDYWVDFKRPTGRDRAGEHSDGDQGHHRGKGEWIEGADAEQQAAD